MSRLLVIFGITGHQGSSIAAAVLNDAKLSKEYKIRGITRSLTSEKSKELLNKGVEMACADFDDIQSIEKAVEGAHTVVAITLSIYTPEGKEEEIAQGKSIVNATVKAGAEYLIFSTSVNVEKLSDGKLNNATMFDSKALIEEYIRKQPIKSSFFYPGSFMQNLENGFFKPQLLDDGTYGIKHGFRDAQIPFVDVDDTGNFVLPILTEPEKYEGKFLAAATAFYTMEDVAKAITKISGKTVNSIQVHDETLISFLPPSVFDMIQYMRDYGYYGPQMKESVEWTLSQARGKLQTLEEFLVKNPLEFD